MKIEDKYKGIPYSDLTEEQFNSLTKIEMINKILSDDVDSLIKYYDKYVLMRKNLFGSIGLAIVSIMSFPLYGLISLLPVLFFIYMVNKRKKNVTWCIRILKVNVALYRGNGDFLTKHDFIFERHLDRLSHINIGELYDAISQK